MKIKIATFIALTLSFFVCNAQSDISKNIEVKKESSCYSINNNIIFSVTYKLYNKSNSNIWLWIENDHFSEVSDSVRIKGYFVHKKEGSDASLYQIGMDRNIEIFIPKIFDTFIKCILPKENFTLQITSKDSISEFTKQEIFKYLDKHIVSYKEKYLLKYIPFLNKMNQMVFFKEEFISLDIDMLIQCSTEVK